MRIKANFSFNQIVRIKLQRKIQMNQTLNLIQSQNKSKKKMKAKVHKVKFNNKINNFQKFMIKIPNIIILH